MFVGLELVATYKNEHTIPKRYNDYQPKDRTAILSRVNRRWAERDKMLASLSKHFPPPDYTIKCDMRGTTRVWRINHG